MTTTRKTKMVALRAHADVWRKIKVMATDQGLTLGEVLARLVMESERNIS